ncbi:MAG: hypothetical protein ACRCU2_07500 [Planktothrix sp.]
MLKIFCCYAFKSFECLTQITNFIVPLLKEGQLGREDKEVGRILFNHLLITIEMMMDVLEIETEHKTRKRVKANRVQLKVINGGKK